MKITKNVMKELNSFEISELTRILEAMEMREYYCSGHKNICGGYEIAEAFDIIEDGHYDTASDKDYDAIEIELESGEQDGGRTHSTKVCYRISRHIVGDKNMALADKLKTIEEV